MEKSEKIGTALLKAAQVIREQKSKIDSLSAEKESLVKKASFQDPEKIRQALLGSASKIRELQKQAEEVDGLREKIAEDKRFRKALSISSQMAEKGAIGWDEVISKTAELKDNPKLDSIADSLEFMGGSVERLFGAELGKEAALSPTTGTELAEEINNWLLS